MKLITSGVTISAAIMTSAITAHRSKHFAGEALRMNAQQGYFLLQIAKPHHQGSLSFSFGHVCSIKACSFKADQLEDAKNRRQVSGGHPTDAAMLRALVHVSVRRNRFATSPGRCNFISITFAVKLLCERKQIWGLADLLRKGFLHPGDRVSRL